MYVNALLGCCILCTFDFSQVCVVKETHPMTAEASHPGYSQSTPSKYMEVGM